MNHRGTETQFQFNSDLSDELARAREQHGRITGAHDGYGRILEELDEVWDHVKRKDKERDPVAMYWELVQVAAMCRRMAEDLSLPPCS